MDSSSAQTTDCEPEDIDRPSTTHFPQNPLGDTIDEASVSGQVAVPKNTFINESLHENLSVSGNSSQQRSKPRKSHLISATRKEMLTPNELKYYLKILRLERSLKMKNARIQQLIDENKKLKESVKLI